MRRGAALLVLLLLLGRLIPAEAAHRLALVIGNISGRAMVRASNGQVTGMVIRAHVSGRKLLGRYEDGWNETGDIVFDLSNPL